MGLLELPSNFALFIGVALVCGLARQWRVELLDGRERDGRRCRACLFNRERGRAVQ